MAENVQITLTLNADGASATLKNFKGEIVSSKIPLAAVEKELGDVGKAAVKAGQSIKITKEQFNGLGKAVGGFKTATGGATASALELGRIVSDMPYGIRGVANNMSQFASMMMFSATATDQATGKTIGFTGAVKGLWTALKGPLGILLAIQAVIAALDHFGSQSKSTGDDSKELSKVFGMETTKLFVLKSALNDSTIALKDKQELVKKANKDFKDLNITLDENGNLTKASSEAVDQLSMSFIKNAKARAIAKLIQDEMTKQAEIEIQETGKQLAWYETAWFALQTQIVGLGKASANAAKQDNENRKKAIEDSQTAVQKYTQLLKDNNAELAKLLFGDKKSKGSSRVKAMVKEFESGLFEIEGLIISNRERELMQTAKTEREKLALKKMFEQEGLTRSYEEQKSANKKDLDEYVKNIQEKVKAGKLSADRGGQLINDATTKHRESDKISYENYLHGLALISDKYNDKIIGLGDGLAATETQGEIEARGLKKILDYKLEMQRVYVESAKQVLSGLGDFIGGEFDRQMVIEQNKTNALNEELNNRLLNESLSTSQRKEIQAEIWRNDEALRIKQEEIAKKKFNAQKAFNIASAIIDTYSAANGFLASKPVTPANFIMAGAAITKGLLNVASIARQKYQSSSAATPPRVGLGGAGGNGVGNRTFDFNLVGNNQSNQIAQAIQGQFSQPVRAYVVSRDVTTQQELDLNIRGNAGF